LGEIGAATFGGLQKHFKCVKAARAGHANAQRADSQGYATMTYGAFEKN
jgi:hypothetical protein